MINHAVSGVCRSANLLLPVASNSWMTEGISTSVAWSIWRRAKSERHSSVILLFKHVLSCQRPLNDLFAEAVDTAMVRNNFKTVWMCGNIRWADKQLLVGCLLSLHLPEFHVASLQIRCLLMKVVAVTGWTLLPHLVSQAGYERWHQVLCF